MDVRFFSTFLEVAYTRHFGKAAENLYLTPAAVSARIKQLEEHFNTTLFFRVRNSIQLTPAGEKLVPYAKSLVDGLNNARNALNEQAAAFLAFGITPNAAACLEHSLMLKLSQHDQSMSFRVDTLSSEQLSRHLHERTIDFAVTSETLKSGDVEHIELCTLKLYLVEPAEENDGENENMHNVHIEWSQKLCDRILGAMPEFKHARFKTNSVEQAIDFLRERDGRAILPDILIKRLEKQGDRHTEKFNKKECSFGLTLYLVRLKEGRHPCVDEITNLLVCD